MRISMRAVGRCAASAQQASAGPLASQRLASQRLSPGSEAPGAAPCCCRRCWRRWPPTPRTTATPHPQPTHTPRPGLTGALAALLQAHQAGLEGGRVLLGVGGRKAGAHRPGHVGKAASGAGGHDHGVGALAVLPHSAPDEAGGVGGAGLGAGLVHAHVGRGGAGGRREAAHGARLPGPGVAQRCVAQRALHLPHVAVAVGARALQHWAGG